MENVSNQDAKREQLWGPAARFVAREAVVDGKVVRRVTLIRRWQVLRPPGSPGPDREPWRRYSYYTLRFPDDSGRSK